MPRTVVLTDTGIPVEQRNCAEICGDGFNFGGVDCDDGNSTNNDGCSSQCTVEKGYLCTGGSPSSPDTCKEVVSPTLELTTVTTGSKTNLETDKIEVRIKFSEEVIFPESCVVNVEIDPSKDFTFSISDLQEEKIIDIEIFPNEAIDSSNKLLISIAVCRIYDKNENELLVYEAQTTLIDYLFYSEEATAVARSIESISGTANTAAGATTSSFFALSILTSSFTTIGLVALWHLIDIA